MAAERALERRIVTVLFCDLVGFTSLSEALDPEDVVAVQDAYFAAVHETVTRYGGTLEKFIGDAAVGVFGVPRVRDDDAAHAVRAALALTSAVDQLGARLGLAAGELRLRVGVNTGEVVYGQASAERGPVTGDTVNVAARLQAAAPPGAVLVGEATALAVEDTVELEAAGPLELKGKAEATRAWRALAERTEPSRERAMGGLRAPMLGRERELERLERSLAELQAGAAHTVAVLAPPGVGKTRLVDELARAAAADATVCRARLRPDVLAPYDGVAQLLAAALVAAGLAADSLTAPAAERLLVDRLSEGGTDPGRAQVVAEAVAAVLFPAAADGQAEPRTETRSSQPGWTRSTPSAPVAGRCGSSRMRTGRAAICWRSSWPPDRRRRAVNGSSSSPGGRGSASASTSTMRSSCLRCRRERRRRSSASLSAAHCPVTSSRASPRLPTATRSSSRSSCARGRAVACSSPRAAVGSSPPTRPR